jgi:hypothetical protein
MLYAGILIKHDMLTRAVLIKHAAWKADCTVVTVAGKQATISRLELRLAERF